MEFVPLVAMAALVLAVINFVKFAKAKDTNGMVTQLSVWIAGVAVVLLVAHTDFAAGLTVGDMTMASLNVYSLVFVGLTLGSSATVLNEFKKALDAGDSAKKPPMVG